MQTSKKAHLSNGSGLCSYLCTLSNWQEQSGCVLNEIITSDDQLSECYQAASRSCVLCCLSVVLLWLVARRGFSQGTRRMKCDATFSQPAAFLVSQVYPPPTRSYTHFLITFQLSLWLAKERRLWTVQKFLF